MRGRTVEMDVKLVAAVASVGLNVRRFCREQAISPSTFYKWRARFLEGGVDGLVERSRRPARSPALIDPAVEDAIVRVRKELTDRCVDAGAHTIWFHLLEAGICAPAPSTIWRVLTRRGLIEPAPAKRPKSSFQRFEYLRPNECWQIDATHWQLADGTAVEIIDIIDDHSRVVVAARVCSGSATSPAAWATLVDAASSWGLPARVLSDNGLVFNGSRRGHHVLFETNLRALGVQPIASSPFHPQTCGKIERFHQTLKKWLAGQPPAATTGALQTAVNTFIAYYNQARPHRGANRRPPLEKWSATPPAGPASHPLTQPTRIHHQTVSSGGHVNIHPWHIAVGSKWIGQRVTLILQHHHGAIFHNHTLIRELTIDPERTYQPLRPVRDVSRHKRAR